MRRLAFLLSLLLLLSTLASCGANEPAGTTATATPPTRVAVLFSSLCEVWQAAGGEVAITVGESVERGLVPADTLLVDDGAGKEIHTELLLAAAPDLVIYSPDIPAQVNAAALADRAGIRTLALRVESFSDYAAAIRTAVALTGHREALDALLLAENAVTALISSEEAAALRGRTFLFIRAGQTASSTKVKCSADHFAAAMLTELGLVNLADTTPHLLNTLSTEAILEADPDYLFFSLMGDAEGAAANIELLLARPEWQTLGAVRSGRVTLLPRELFHYKPCTRWQTAYAYLLDTLKGKEATP